MALGSCYACSKIIYDKALTWEDRAYHPHCFICDHCQTPIREKRFVVYEGRP